MIRYGTFDQLSERLMTEKHGLVREQMQASLQGRKPRAAKTTAQPDRVLLIDEVDVFLDPAFFSGKYRPSLMIGDEKPAAASSSSSSGPDRRVSAFLRAIWADPSKNPTDLQEYKDLFNKPAIVAKDYEWFAQSAAVEMQR